MRKETNEKGITLVALIITIIILVILAAVSIGQVTSHKIVDVAVNGTESYVYEQAKDAIQEAMYYAILSSFDDEEIKFDYSMVPDLFIETLRKEGYTCEVASTDKENCVLYKVTGKNPACTFDVEMNKITGEYTIELAR